jgi:phage tail-like protein
MAAPYFSLFRFQVWFTQDESPSGSAPSTAMADAGFSDVAGLEAQVEIKAQPEGGRNQGVRQLPGRTVYPPLVLKRGMSRNFEAWRWFDAVVRGVRPVPRKGVIVELLAADGSGVAARWTVSRAMPMKMKISDLSAKSAEVAIEELQLSHEGWTLDLSLGVQ